MLVAMGGFRASNRLQAGCTIRRCCRFAHVTLSLGLRTLKPHVERVEARVHQQHGGRTCGGHSQLDQ